ncbi:hypothetical protein ColLi_09281 [Colletotrichum liriopes]|uniref:Uncharacterized protein n=1 Tax=Colletotrichum liriopes TaxID=708192 RepID=A0AA37LWE5_9PEZI|nr:hypothetical protein ColLi_09281 [Colletotrichum liriopes]
MVTWQVDLRTLGAGKSPRGFSLPVKVDDDLRTPGAGKAPGAFLYLLRWMMTWKKPPGAFLYLSRWMTPVEVDDDLEKAPGAFLYLSRWMVTWQVDLAENTWGWKKPPGAFLYLSRWMTPGRKHLGLEKPPGAFLYLSRWMTTWRVHLRTPGAGKAPRGFSLPVEVDDDLAENTWE